ncbi:hypothetical protein CMU40_14570 [Elizabethkingia anophelis]|nr:hypothetical protein [Elizabethkingia anophelis]MDV3727409.1 hypothetical protein [Elizabethkingia anophelis]MDV3728438.1 hypothetical protein [Elizabethkingia anophelis]MDV3743362.1 hypothetical protein [Elizabethkingia anophelis]MDV3767765.1 hypothetical protein [Elizabethkingia anophelis]
MTEQINEIIKDKYSNELAYELSKISRNNPANNEIENLYILISCELADDAFKNLFKEASFSLPEVQTKNIEILARVNDVKFILGNPDKLSCIKESVKFYIEIYEKTDDLKYMIRALELVRKVKSVFTQNLPQLKQKTLQLLTSLESAYYQLKLLDSALFLIQETSSNKLIDYFIIQLEQSLEKKQFNQARIYIKALNKLGHFDNNQFKIQTAFCLEREADHYVSQKEPNTYYPNILSLYVDALKQIKGIAVDESFKTRLEQKIKKEQKIYIEMLRNIAIEVESDLNIPELVATQNIKSFNSGFNFLLSLPIFDLANSKKIPEKQDKEYFWQQFFQESIYYTNKGTVSGISDAKNHDSLFMREHYRNIIISIIKEVKFIMDFDKQISKNLIAEMIVRCESPFIPDDRQYLFIEGIYSGFQNNFILASHLLIPQIENSLKHIVELNSRNTTRLSDDIQNDNTLGSILGTDENGKMLDGICDRGLLLELNSFLVDGAGINYRNKVCHGLISPFEMNYYGIYLWWITLKIIKQTDKYFKTDKLI